MFRLNLKILNSAICFFLFYLFLEGVLRKWIFPGISGSLLYSIKYFLLIIIAISYILLRNNGLENSSTPIGNAYKLYGLVIILSAVCVTFIINGIIVGCITLIQYLSPLILIYVIPIYIYDKQKLNKFLRVGVIIAFIIFILAFIQYASPPTAYINKYAMEMKNGIAMVGEATRVCSVFSYITPFGDFCIVVVAFTTCLLTLKWKYKIMNEIVLLLFIFALLGCFMVGSRSVVIISFLIVLGKSLHEWIYKRNLKLIVGIFFIIFCAFVYYKLYGIAAIDNFILRLTTSSSDVDTRISRTFDITRMFDYAGAFGYGVGIANSSVQSLLIYRSSIDWEEEIGRVMIELGFLGFLIVTIIKIYVLFYMVKISRSINSRYLSALSWASTITIIPMTFYIQLCLYNWFAYIVYFMMLGLNIALRNLDNNYADCDVY